MSRLRIVLVGVLLALIGAAAYRVGTSLWAHYHYQAALQALEHYDFAQADASLQKYLSVHPGDPDVLLEAARTARRRGDFKQALSRLKEAEKHGAAAEPVYIERQLLFTQTGDMTHAGELQKMCIANPAAQETTWMLEALIEGASLNPMTVGLAKWGVDFWFAHRTGKIEKVRGLIWRARVHEFSDELPLALRDLREAVELAPDNVPARLRLVEALIRDEPREALPHVEWLRLHAAGDLDVRFQTGRLCRSLGQPEQAVQWLDEVLAVTPDRVPVLLERGRVALDLNRSEEALRLLLRAHDLLPDGRDVNVAMAECMRQLGRLEEAKLYQDRAQEILKKLEASRTASP